MASWSCDQVSSAFSERQKRADYQNAKSRRTSHGHSPGFELLLPRQTLVSLSMSLDFIPCPIQTQGFISNEDVVPQAVPLECYSKFS